MAPVQTIHDQFWSLDEPMVLTASLLLFTCMTDDRASGDLADEIITVREEGIVARAMLFLPPGDCDYDEGFVRP
jgi:hypothetical protein